MSDQEPQGDPQEPAEPQEPAQQPQGSEPEPPAQPEPKSQDEETDWKAEARKWEKRAKDNADKAKRLDEIEDEKKTEQERLSEQLETARSEGSKATAQLTRLEVALDKAPEGMPLSRVRKLAARLSGDTREELESDADDLFAEFAPSDDPEDDPEGEPDKGGGRRPKERLRPGATPAGEPEPEPDELADQIERKSRGY